MTGKVLNQGVSSALVLILPLALIVVLVLKAWPYLIVLFILVALLNLWQTFRWKQQCQKVDPFFYALISENQGYLTPIDLAVKANLSAAASDKFLAKKAQEYGAQSKKINNKVAGYYFLTANALKSIFEESEPLPEIDDISLSTSNEFTSSTSETTIETNPVDSIEETLETPLVESSPETTIETNLVDSIEEETIETPLIESSPETTIETNLVDSTEEETIETPLVESSPETTIETNLVDSTEEETIEKGHLESTEKPTPLTQVELAKRLNTNPSAIRKKRAAHDFTTWSQSRDPQGIAWRFTPQDNSSKSVIFEPIINEKEEEQD